MKTIAFPAISTGIYGYPKKDATELAVRIIQEEMKKAEEDFEVWHVAFGAGTKSLYQEAIQTEN